MSRHAVILSAVPVAAALGRYVQPGDFIVACDAGYSNAARLGLQPDLIVGDFDSAPQPKTAQETIVLPHVKDDTDTQYAARWLLEQGYDVGEIDITVGTSYEATGEAMAAGAIDVGWLPGGTYAVYSKDHEVSVILTATRDGLSNDSTNPADWNGIANKTLPVPENQVGFYRSLIYATPSPYGKVLAEKVNNGEALTWEDLDKASWAVLKTSSSAGYIYPTIWLMDNYGKKITDLTTVATLSGYGEAFAQAAAESVDVIVCYADGRRDYEEAWKLPVTETAKNNITGFGRTGEIWDEVNVIGVTGGIYNDTVSITTAKPEINNPQFIEALQNALINVINTEEGHEIFSVYSHTGYVKAVDSDYDFARKALEYVQ